MPETPVTMADVLGKSSGPALSATSDMPAPAPTPEPTPIPEPVVKPEAKAEGETPKPPEPPATEPPQEPPKKSGIQERFGEMAAQRRAAEARADKLADELQTAIGAIKDLTGKVSTEAKPAAEDQRPKRESFDNPEAYDSALIEWSGRQASRVAKAEVEKERAEAEKKATDERNRQANEELRKSWTDRVAKVKEKHADFDEVVAREDVVLSPAMTDAMLRADNGAEIGYYFGQHPEEAQRIAAIQNPVMQVYEMGRLSASLAEKPNVSHTPPPITPLGSRNASGPKSPDEMTMEEYAAAHPLTKRRSEALAARRGMH